MKKILFLDDYETRHTIFKSRTIGMDVTHVYTAKAAIAALKETKFDVVSLDHDLAEELNMLMPDKGEGSGYDVAVYISEMPEEMLPELVIVHSLNPPGAERMMQALHSRVKVIRDPFSYR